MSLIKEYVITEISAASDGSPFILITLKNPSDVRGPQRKVNNPSMVIPHASAGVFPFKPSCVLM